MKLNSSIRSTLLGTFVGAAVSLVTAWLFLLTTMASAVPGTAYVYRGMYPEPQTCYPWGQFTGHNSCWHDDETGTYTAVDYNYGSNPEDDAGALVQLWYTGTRQYWTFQSLVGTNCTGVRVVLYHDSSKTNYAGELHYLHINPGSGVIGSGYDYYDSGGGFYYRDLGTVKSPEATGCSWDHAHLHQSANTDASTAFYTNWDADPTSSWEHKIQ